MEFCKPPVIHNTASRGVYVEGSHRANAADKETLLMAVQNYGHLVPRNAQLTGAQWMAQIARQYDAGEPRNAAVLAAIGRVMLVEQYKDDHLAFDSAGAPTWRGRESECLRHACGGEVKPVAACTADQCEKATLAMTLEMVGAHGRVVDILREKVLLPNGFLADFFGLPANYRIVLPVPAEDERTSMLQRQLLILLAPPVGAENFSAEQAADHEAQLALMIHLATHLGYGALAAPMPAGVSAASVKPSTLPRRDGDKELAIHDVEESMVSYAGSLLEAGWAPGPKNPWYLCRPAPLDNPLASLRYFECIVHPTLVGWRLPQALVERVCEQIHQCETSTLVRERN